MSDLSDIVKRMMNSDFDDSLSLIEDVWDKCSGLSPRGGARPLYFKDGRLTVKCDSSAMIFELRGRKKSIMERLNGYLGKNDIKDIYFRQ